MYNVYYADNLLEWSNTTLPCLIESLNAPILISKQNSKLKYINPNEGQNHYRFMVKVEPIVLGSNPNPPLSSSETSDKNIPKGNPINLNSFFRVPLHNYSDIEHSTHRDPFRLSI
jgi:hypothetical protein